MDGFVKVNSADNVAVAINDIEKETAFLDGVCARSDIPGPRCAEDISAGSHHRQPPVWARNIRKGGKEACGLSKLMYQEASFGSWNFLYATKTTFPGTPRAVCRV